MRLLFLILVFSLFSSCDQVGIGVKNAVGNFFSAPYRGIRDGIRQKRYESLEEETDKNRALSSEGKLCLGVLDGVDESVKGLMGVRDKLVGATCECKQWGTCTVDLCSCAKLCPEDLTIFKRSNVSSTKEYSKKENSLAFRNDYSMPTNYPMTQGYCWGHASVTSKFNRLGFFKPSASSPRKDFNSRDPKKRAEAIKFYQKIIDDIVDNKATDIPGYKNLEELSSDPALETYIGDKVADSWGERAMSFQGMSTAVGSSAMNREKNASFFEQVKRKIDNHQQPQVVFTKKGSVGMTHAVLVSHYKRTPSGQLVLCIRDNNERPISNYNCANTMYIGNDGEIRYRSWGKLGKVVVAHNENSDAVVQQESLVEKCKGEKCQQVLE